MSEAEVLSVPVIEIKRTSLQGSSLHHKNVSVVADVPVGSYINVIKRLRGNQNSFSLVGVGAKKGDFGKANLAPIRRPL